ncbi:MAG: Abi family protein [Ureaplasma sp.]|nr:Abi family protein [Ureaplasma sp.]
MIKPHLTIVQQIDLLKSRNLKIDDWEEIYSYLSNYSYQILINGYNDPFMKNFDRNKNEYAYNSSTRSIISLFNYDENISLLLLKDIRKVEKKLLTTITYYISDKLSKLNKNDGRILEIDNSDFKQIFSNKGNREEICKLMSKYLEPTDKFILKYVDEFSEYNFYKIPIWILSIKWTFGSLIQIFKLLNKEIQYKIIYSFNLKINIKQFIKIMGFLNIIRNKIAHGHVLYNLKFKLQDDSIQKFIFINKLDIRLINFELRLFDFIKIICKINNDNNLLEKFKNETLNSIINCIYITNEPKEYICNEINFK